MILLWHNISILPKLNFGCGFLKDTVVRENMLLKLLKALEFKCL